MITSSFLSSIFRNLFLGLDNILGCGIIFTSKVINYSLIFINSLKLSKSYKISSKFIKTSKVTTKKTKKNS